MSSSLKAIHDSSNDDSRIERRILILLKSHCATNCLQHVRSRGQRAIVSKSRAAHRELITCNMFLATLYEGTAQLCNLDSSAIQFDRVQITLFFCSFLLSELLSSEGGEETGLLGENF